MPFDEEDDSQESFKNNLKKVSSQKSIFDSMPKKPSQKDFNEQVKQVEDRKMSYKQQAAELSLSFKKMMSDKTLPQNRNIFLNEIEQDTLSKLINLGSTINQDPNEQESMGSLMLITLMLKTCLYQRDRINKLEYIVSQLDKKTDSENLKSMILKEIQGELDKKKNSE